MHEHRVEGAALGDDSLLDPALEREFRATGLSHLLVVSGENVDGARAALLPPRLLAPPELRPGHDLAPSPEAAPTFEADRLGEPRRGDDHVRWWVTPRIRHSGSACQGRNPYAL